MTLMLVEDNLEFRNMLKNLFVKYFSEIIETDNGDDALEKFDIHRPDWVFMDISLAKSDGISSTRKIKLKHPEAKIVMVSQYNNPRIINASLKAGAFDFVTKDDISNLFNIINKAGS